MNEQRFGIVRTIGVSQPDRFRWFCCSGAGFGEFASVSCQRWFGDTVDNDFLARFVIVTDVAEVEIRFSAFWSRSRGHIFPVACLRACYAENAERIATSIEGID